MIDISATAATALLSGNQRRYVRVESWYGDQLVDDNVPVDDGEQEVDRAANVPERVTLLVPRFRDGVDYAPGAETSPLAANGQRLRVLAGIGLGPGVVEWLQLGWFVITESEADTTSVSVAAAGLLWKIDEARLVNPLQPSGTFKSTVRSLVEPAIPVVFDPALTDRSVPGSVTYDDDRLGALNTTLAAWPAVADVTEAGYLYVTTDADPAVSVLDLTDGYRGTVIEATGKSSRDGVYNAAVAQGQMSDGQLVRGVAYDLTGPKRAGGPFNELPVPRYLDSPLITTQAQANAAAATLLNTIRRRTARSWDVEMVPHPALQTGDRITLTTSTLDAVPAVVESLRLPLVADGGSQRLRVREVI